MKFLILGVLLTRLMLGFETIFGTLGGATCLWQYVGNARKQKRITRLYMNIKRRGEIFAEWTQIFISEDPERFNKMLFMVTGLPFRPTSE